MDVEKVVRELIDKTFHMSLATSASDKPWVCEVHFAYDDNLNLYFRSLAARRHSQEIARNSRVAGNIIDKHELDDPVNGLYFEGSTEQLSSGKDQDLAFETIKRRLKVNDDALQEAKTPDGHQFYRITVENFYVFGNFDGNGSQKFQLNWS